MLTNWVMFLSKIQVGNYKSLYKPAPVELRPGFNIICGQNNAGKTALLEALDPNTPGNPHRSLKTVPTAGSQPDPISWLNFSVCLTQEELRTMLRELGPRTYRISFPMLESPFAQRMGLTQSVEGARRLVEVFLGQDKHVFRLRKEFAQGAIGPWLCQTIPSSDLYPAGNGPWYFATFLVGIDGAVSRFGVTGPQSDDKDVGLDLIPAITNRVYRFNAERMNVGVSQFGNQPRLAPNAANLPEVLNVLQGNASRFSHFNRLVSEVLPQIRQISVSPTGNQSVEIRVWTSDPASGRQDLTLPLAQSGTGIGQVLAILYVVVFSSGPQVIAIDELQTFLHPGAVRKLIQVLKGYPQHQFIVATHSPTAISAADPVTLTMCKISDGESTLETLDPGDASALQSYLAEVGARLSDVFGVDNILWVEGRTEELCFPLILERVAKRRLRGTLILAVSNTGDLRMEDAVRVFDMYNRMSGRGSLLPPATGFIFDSECRADHERTELIHRSRDLLKFLPRRMYENYLLNPSAIAAVASQIQGFRDTAVREEEVAALIDTMRLDQKYSRPLTVEITERSGLSRINAALVLKDIFAHLSESRVSFEKIKHSVLLTEWLIDNSPDDLKEVNDLVLSCMPRIQA